MLAFLDFRSEQFFFPFMIYKSPQCFLSSFKSIGLSVQDKKWKIVFKRRPWRTSWIFDLNNFSYYFFICSYFWSIHLSNASYQISSQLAFLFGRRSEIDFQDGGHSGNLGLTIETILASFDIQVSPMLPTNFQADWPFGSGVEAKNRFSRSRP